MGCKRPHIAVIVGLIAAFIALVFQIIAVAATGWMKSIYDTTLGLWKGCSSSICVDIPSVFETDALKATRAFALLGLIFIALALFAGVLIMFIDKKVMNLIAGTAAIAAAVFVVIGFAVYAGDFNVSPNKQLYELSYCFALTVVAFVLCIVSGISFILSNIF